MQGGKTVNIAGQDWIYPSEGQCMECHTSAAGFALGPETAQLNKEFTYPSTQRIANQLETLDHVMMLQTPYRAWRPVCRRWRILRTRMRVSMIVRAPTFTLTARDVIVPVDQRHHRWTSVIRRRYPTRIRAMRCRCLDGWEIPMRSLSRRANPRIPWSLSA